MNDTRHLTAAEHRDQAERELDTAAHAQLTIALHTSPDPQPGVYTDAPVQLSPVQVEALNRQAELALLAAIAHGVLAVAPDRDAA